MSGRRKSPSGKAPGKSPAGPAPSRRRPRPAQPAPPPPPEQPHEDALEDSGLDDPVIRAVAAAPKAFAADPRPWQVGLAETMEVGRPLAGRYRLNRKLGQGAGGVVFAGRDELTGQAVAVKLLWPHFDAAPERVGREIAALRALDLRGIAQLIDTGLDGDQRFMVMELVEGAPFPGTSVPCGWAALARPALDLLETLQQIHEQGIVHRDLKPSNVLVRRDGRVVILDFGLARGKALGETITHTGAVLGTPRYQAPEQIQGLQADARADLYAVGVMLYEALSGQAPHAALTLESLYQLRVGSDVEPLERRVAEVPAGVAVVIDWLLARDPDARPRSATEVLNALRAEPVAEGRDALPWLGSRDPLQTVVGEVLQGRGVTVGGARGSGRTRFLREVVHALTAQGRTVLQLLPRQRPYGSLESWLDLDALAAEGAGAVGDAVVAELRRRSGQGTVLVADDSEALDRWTRAALDRVREDVAFLRVVPGTAGADVVLEPLGEAALQGLFHGPDRLLHLREDGARELHRRTGGWPVRLVREVSAWIGAGLALWDGARLRITRDSLRRLAVRPHVPVAEPGVELPALTKELGDLLAWVTLAWPHASFVNLESLTERRGWELRAELEELVNLGVLAEVEPDLYEPRATALELQSWTFVRRQEAHSRLAKQLPPGAPSRLNHVVAAGTAGEIAAEAVAVASRQYTNGRLDEAAGAVAEALRTVRELGDDRAETRLLVELARLAILDQTAAAHQRAHYELGRGAERGGHPPEPGSGWDEVARMRALLEAALELPKPGGGRALELADAVAPFERLELEVVRQQVRANAGLWRGADAAEAVLDGLLRWAESQPEWVRGYVDGWMGLLFYRRSRFDEAVEWQRRAAERRPDVGGRLAARVNEAYAHLEAFRWYEAESAADDIRSTAIELRLPLYEAYAELLGRSARYRRADALQPDLELCEAVDALARPPLSAPIHLNEAAVAWRLELNETAARLARRAHELWVETGNAAGVAIAKALELAARGRCEPEEADALLDSAERGRLPRVAAQVYGLLGRAVDLGALSRWRPDPKRLEEAAPQPFWGSRLEVLSLDESLAFPKR